MKKKGLAAKWRGASKNDVVSKNVESSILVLKTHEESIAELERPDLAAARREETRRRRLNRIAAALATLASNPPQSVDSASDGRRNNFLLLSKVAGTAEPSGSDSTLATEATAMSSSSGAGAGFEEDEIDDGDDDGGEGPLAEHSDSDEFPGSDSGGNGSSDAGHTDADVGAGLGSDGERGDLSRPDPSTFKDVGTSTRSVSFSTVTIRSHPIELGDNPSVTRGPPITISWRHDPEQSTTLSVDDYEDSHPPRRVGEEMILPRTQREIMLKEAGVGRGEMKEAARLAERVNRQRMKSAMGYERIAKIRSTVSLLKVWRWGS